MKADHEPGGAPEIARECAFPGDGRRHACNRRSSTVLEWGPCCYCGLPIRATEIDPCRLRVETAEGKWQVWFCHSACVKERLPDRPELMGLFSPAHFTTPSPHLIAILMSPEGRFLQCRNCQLSFTFPNGAQFGVIAKQFGSYLCSSPMRIPARRLIAASSSSDMKVEFLPWRHARSANASSSRRQHSRATLLERRSTWDRSLMCMSVKNRRDRVMASRVVRCVPSHLTNGKRQQYG